MHFQYSLEGEQQLSSQLRHVDGKMMSKNWYLARFQSSAKIGYVRILGLLFCFSVFLVSIDASAGNRANRRFGLGFEGYSPNFGIIGGYFNFSDSLRLEVGPGSTQGNKSTAFKGSLKPFLMSAPASLFLLAGYLSFSGQNDQLGSKGGPIALAGVDYQGSGGLLLNIGGYYILNSKSGVTFSIGYFFKLAACSAAESHSETA